MDLHHTQADFRTTQWTHIRALAEGSDHDRNKMLALLIARYWPPVYAHLRAHGRRPDDAAELTQAFFTDVVLGRQLFDKADARRGKLRSLLLSSLQRFAIDQHRRSIARGAAVTIPLDDLRREEQRFGDPADSRSDGAFDRRWAMLLLEEALRRCEDHFRSLGRDGHWQAFEARVLHPQVHQLRPPPLTDVAARYHFDSPAAAASAVHLVKQRAVTILRQVIAETLDDGEDVHTELAELQEHLAL